MLFPIIGLALTFSISQIINSNVNDVKAYTRSSLTNTINLNDSTSTEIKNYYSSLTKLSENEKKGQNLLKNLKTILMNGQKYYSYDKGKEDIWKMYEIIDRDWVKSPASSISSYDSSTNTITNYIYKDGSDPYVHALYVNRNVDNQMHAWKNHQQSLWGINQEHIWAKSQGFEELGDGGARGDPMHLWAADGKSNNLHSNDSFGYVDMSKTYSTPSGIPYAQNNLKGTSNTLGSGSVFEPQDSDKGDIARAIFYMAARYNYISGSDKDGIDSDNPNLKVSQMAGSKASYTSTTSIPGEMGCLTDLLYWNHIDPPDEFEIHRNNLLFNNYTHNRNPFIDYPEWADYIWGSVKYDGRNYQSYNSTPTGSVNLLTDKINGFKDGTGLTISDTNLFISVNEEAKISATSSNGGDISWTTSDSEIASISSSTSASKEEITITGASKGDATITASIKISGKTYSQTCDVVVTGGGTILNKATIISSTSDLKINDEYIIIAADTNEYKYALSTTQNAYNRGAAEISVDGNTITFDNNVQVFTLKAGNKENTYSFYDEEINGYIYAASSSNNYLKTQLTNNDNSSFAITFSDSTSNLVAQGTNTRNKIQYNKASNLFSCYAEQNTQEKVSICKVIKSEPVTGVTLNKSVLELQNGTSEILIATVLPSSASDKTVTWSSSNTFVANVNDSGNVSALSEGETVITVTTNDGGFTASCNVTVTEDTITSIYIDESSSKLSYYVDEQFDKNDITVKANYAHISSTVLDNKKLTFSVANNHTFTESEIASGVELTVSYTKDNQVFNSTKTLNVSACSGAIYTLSGESTISGKNVPQNSSATYFSSYGTVQLPSNKYMTITLIGYQYNKITGISLLMRSNKLSGSGYLSVKANDTVIANIGDSSNPLSFDDESFNGSFSDAYHYINIPLSSEYLVKINTQIIIRIDSTENSLYCKGVNVRYVGGESPTVESLSLSGNYQTTFKIGEKFNHNNMVVTANLSDKTTQDVTSQSSWSNPDMSSAGKKTVTVTYLESYTTYEITVSKQPRYEKVTSEQSSWEGTYLLVYESSETTGLTWTGVDAGKCHSDVTILNDVISNKPENAVTLTISPMTSQMTNGYSIRLNGGVNDGKYIGRAGYSNGIDVSENECLNTISLGEGGVDIVGEGKCKLRYNKTSGENNERFRFYTSNQEVVQLYRLTDYIDEDLLAAENYSTKLDTCIVCYSGSQTPTIDGSTWPELENEFNQLSNESKNYLIDATYVVVGNTVTPLGETTQKIANGMAKYDQLVSRYAPTYSNFMKRDLPTSNVTYIIKNFNNTTILVTSILTVISISVLVAYKRYNVGKKH